MYYIMNSGKLIDLKNISENDIHISDIAHHLTKICRYGGALPLNTHYSVANHSIALVYYAMEKGYSEDVQRALLLHDAGEAYLGDIVIGLKRLLPEYKKLEDIVESMIENKYNIALKEEQVNLVKELDSRIALDEANVFFPEHFDKFNAQLLGEQPLGIKIYKDASLELTKRMFLHTCEMLGVKDE